MLRFLKKRWEKSPKTSRKTMPLATTHQITKISAERGADDTDETDETVPPDDNHGGGSRIAAQDIGDQQLPTSNPSTMIPGRVSNGAVIPQERGHAQKGSTGTRIKQPSRSSPDLDSTEGDSTLSRGKHEDGEPGVQLPSKTSPERTSSGGQDGGDLHDLVQSGRSRVKERGWVDRALERTAVVVDLAKGPAEAFGPLKAVLGSISALYAQYQNTVDVKFKIDTLHSRITTLEELFEEPAGDEKETKRRGVLSIKLNDIEEQLQSLREKSALLRFVDNVYDSGDVNGLLGDLQEAVGDYMMVQQMAIYDHGCKLMDAAEKSALNNFRCANGAEFRHGERKGCLKGTRGIVLNAIELWTRDPEKRQVYWLNGLAGTGKSSIAKTIAERLFADGRLGASFFCSRDFEDRRNIQLIFPTLATQLARKYTEFRSIFVPLIQSDPGIAYESLYNQMDKLIVRPLNRSSTSTVIVIDALDECEDEEPASAILSVLGQLASEIPKVKFFLTGRPESRISEGFRLPVLAGMTDVFVLHSIEPSEVDNDIRLFFRSSFSELAGRRSGLDNWPAEEQVNRLCRRAAGLFVYAAATVKFINNYKRDPRNQLDRLLESQKIGACEGKTLDTLYTSILREAFGDDAPGDDARIRAVLGAVILAVNPLSPSAIATLLGFNTRDVPPLLLSVNSLLILQEDSNHPVRPFHKSFPDFVTDPDRCTNKRFLISPPDHHFQLLISCLDLMNRTLAKNMCNLPDAVTNSDVSDLKERTEKYIDPALRYACLSWHMHLVHADTIPAHAPTITSTIHWFLEKTFLFWLETLSVLDAVRDAVEALQVAIDRLEEPSTLDLANDCFRFVTGYFEIIGASAPHIYHSALVSAPQESIVRKLYASHARPFAKVIHGLPRSWDANTAATTRPFDIEVATWSPCNRLISIIWRDAEVVDVLDSVTLQRLQTLEFLQARSISTKDMVLAFSPDSRILTCFGKTPSDGELFVDSWDLQTGGIASVIRWKGPNKAIEGTPFITYSANGKMVGICCRHFSGDHTIFILDVISGAHTHSPSLTIVTGHVIGIWARGGSLLFVTAGAKTITIWEVKFALDAVPTEIESLPLPEIAHRAVDLRWHECKHRDYIYFLPTQYRLALIFEDKAMIWDTRNSKFLLYNTGTAFLPIASFSSDGRFFACSTAGSDVYLWRESPTGYTLHGMLASGTLQSSPLLSPNGELIIAFGGSTIRLWRTKGFTVNQSSVLTQTPQPTANFVLDFSPDGMLAVVARQEDNMVTVLNLKSGVPQLNIDVDMEVCGLRVIGSTVTVIGYWKVATWNLPREDQIHNAKVTLKDSIQVINLKGLPLCDIIGASISHDSHYLALTMATETDLCLCICDGSTGEKLTEDATVELTPWFAPGGYDLWLVDDSGNGRVLRVGSGQQVLQVLEHRIDIEHPPHGHPWISSFGYLVTSDWWILGPNGKRLLMLPPPWQSPAIVEQVWKGKFLALLHDGLSDPVILEVDQ